VDELGIGHVDEVRRPAAAQVGADLRRVPQGVGPGRRRGAACATHPVDAPAGIDTPQGDVIEGEVLDDAGTDWPEPAEVPDGGAQ
jgi:hypothetical protein